MKNKIIVVIFIIFSFMAAPAHAKDKQQAQKVITIDDIVAKMTAQLELTDTQVAEVKPIIENFLIQEKQLKLEEKKQLAKVLNSDQMFTWNFLQNAQPKDKKKHTSLF